MKSILFAVIALLFAAVASAGDCKILFNGLPVSKATAWQAGQKISIGGQFTNMKKANDLNDYKLILKRDRIFGGAWTIEDAVYSSITQEGLFNVTLTLPEEVDGAYRLKWKRGLRTIYWTNRFYITSANLTATSDSPVSPQSNATLDSAVSDIVENDD
ncbi:hypothetical protein MP228_007220 [Amoeboaphelidium protococcarum]|nr:hypothetical protein MP228_007220 [Amoeboaphelidium protococcarum]